ncbi:MAG TPA: lysophospholipid acyltransferase family protein [Bdellovibrionota bacterium]|nr:lysophospholipid acyltransferase family protein [Bdellovibrionota bacterium]
MKAFFGKRLRDKVSLQSLAKMNREELLYQGLPKLILELMEKYFRIVVEGMENIPRFGKGLIVANHSGFTGFDAVMIGYEIFKQKHRIIRPLVHNLWFTEQFKVMATNVGFVEASKEAGIEILNKNRLSLLFPEGEEGNFKPFPKRYQLQEFKRGFVRMTMETQAPIIPAYVIGAEESNITLSQLSLAKQLFGRLIPIPLNVVPLPAKWKIGFLPPIDMSSYTKEDTSNKELVHKIANDVQNRIQQKIDQELEKRTFVFFADSWHR